MSSSTIDLVSRVRHHASRAETLSVCAMVQRQYSAKGYNVLPIWKDRMDCAHVGSDAQCRRYLFDELPRFEGDRSAGCHSRRVMSSACSPISSSARSPMSELSGLIAHAADSIYCCRQTMTAKYRKAIFRSNRRRTTSFFSSARHSSKGDKRSRPETGRGACGTDAHLSAVGVWEKDAKPMQFPNGSGKRVNMMYPVDNRYWTKLKAFVGLRACLGDRSRIARCAGFNRRFVKGQPFNPTAKRARTVADARSRPRPENDPGAAPAGAPRRPQPLLRRPTVGARLGRRATAEWLQESYLDVNQRAAYFQVRLFLGARHGDAHRRGRVRNIPARASGRGRRIPERVEQLPAAPAARTRRPPCSGPSPPTTSPTGRCPRRRSSCRRSTASTSVASNNDGSIDLWFGPEKPADAPASNWIQTVEGRNFLRGAAPLWHRRRILRPDAGSRTTCVKVE